MKVEDVKMWLQSDVTKEMFDMVATLKDDCDDKIHRHLAKQELDQASYFNAAMVQLEEVLEIPEIIIDNIKAEEEDSET